MTNEAKRRMGASAAAVFVGARVSCVLVSCRLVQRMQGGLGRGCSAYEGVWVCRLCFLPGLGHRTIIIIIKQRFPFPLQAVFAVRRRLDQPKVRAQKDA